MKVAFLSLFLYDTYYPKEVAAHRDDPDYFDREILANHSDPVHKWCKMLLKRFGEAEFWYLSAFAGEVKTFRHKFGHTLRRIPGFDLSTYLGRLFPQEFSIRLFGEMKREGVTHLLALPYLQNPHLPLDLFDLVALWGQRNGVRVFPIYGGGSLAEYPSWKGALKGRIIRKTDGLLCQSRRELDLTVGRFGYPRERAHYFKNPLDLDNFAKVPREESAARLGLDPEKKYILYVGRLVQAKGVHHLMNVFRDLLREDPALCLLIVGWGPLEETFRRQVAEADIGGAVRIVHAVPNEEIRHYYSLAEMTVLPSYSEGTPNVLMEAIACGCPCVATDVGGIPELLEGGLGLSVKPGDEGGLRGAIQTVLAGHFSPDGGARQRLLDEIDFDHKAKELERILRAS